MNLSERAKIKQEIVKETGYKTTANKQEKQILCEDKYSKCYIDNNKLMFETTILGESSVYKMSGHPYEPVIILDCLSNPNNSFQIHGEEYFPDYNDNIVEWVSFIKYINSRILINKYVVSYDEYIHIPNQKVVIKNSYNSWYICESDDKNVLNISGSFSKDTIAYILANKEQKLYFKEYKYNDIEKEKYIHVHYRCLDSINNKTSKI